ncbi:MAG: tRNA-dihydrouridine synthase family protein [Lachnospiraceae bacterium]|nr:tRNA-dihydrouridine synthase family protein [Lachnospiraceae bacterium]
MKIYMAPLEGITGYIYRNAYEENFGKCIDKYFAPFIVPSDNKRLAGKEIRDIIPENNYIDNMYLVPQILTNNATHFLKAATQLKDMGYNEINFNAGCPSGTVVNKNRGAGFLKDPIHMKRFFDEVFDGAEKLGVKVSVKTRIGFESPLEFEDILKVFNQFPFEEIIIHPRTGKQMYKGIPDMEQFEYTFDSINVPICYNGDINSVYDYSNIISNFSVKAVMIGRGIIRNPMLPEQIVYGCDIDYDRIRKFHDDYYHKYCEVINGDTHILFKMREVWIYMSGIFENPHKCLKMVRKAQSLKAYDEAVDRIFSGARL